MADDDPLSTLNAACGVFIAVCQGAVSDWGHGARYRVWGDLGMIVCI